MTGSFEVLAHTADTGFRAWGPNLAGLFETAAWAMFSLEYAPDSAPQDRSEAVSVEGDDPEAALYAWLSELIWLHDALGFVPACFRVTAVGSAPSGVGLQVVGSALGAHLGDWFVQTGPQLKAVTMHGLSVGCSDSGCEATVYLDV